MDVMLTIAVEGSDFASLDEYVTSVKLNGQSVGGRYLENDGRDSGCGPLYKILDHTAVPAGSISQSGELRVQIETSSAVGGVDCNGRTLYAKVTIAGCSNCPAGKYKTSPGSAECSNCPANSQSPVGSSA